MLNFRWSNEEKKVEVGLDSIVKRPGTTGSVLAIACTERKGIDGRCFKVL